MSRAALIAAICVAALLVPAPVHAAAPVRVVGTDLRQGDRPFRVFGFNHEFNGEHPSLDYLEHPSRAHRIRLRRDFAKAARLGANTLRVYVELHQVMASPTRTRPQALRALRTMLREAERAGVLLDVTGNLVWHPGHSPGWYEALPEAERWQVQARFWRAVAEVGARSNGVLMYELTSEPAIGAWDSWYAGELIHHYVQYIVRDPAGRDEVALARAWTSLLRDAIRSRDTRHLISIGLLPIRDWGFDPRNVADLLDVVTVHVYPMAGTEVDALRLVRYFARRGRPLILGETFAFDRRTQESFLLGARRWLDGSLSFFDGRAPEDVDTTTAVGAAYRENLITYLGLRTSLAASPPIAWQQARRPSTREP